MLPHRSPLQAPPGGRAAAPAAVLLVCIAGCAAVAPALTSLAVAFAQDLLAAVSVNYTPRYATHVEELLVALAREGSSLPLEAQLASSGYEPPPPDYAREQGGYQDPYGQQGQPGGYPDPHAQQSPQGGYQDPYAQAPQPPSQATAGDPYAYGTPRLRSTIAPISMNAVLVAEKAGKAGLVTVEDGDVLRDGRGDPARGDRLKVHFQVNCACYVYVLGIDATGYVASVFPDPDDPARGNPVQPGTQYDLPRGDEWWGLDDYRGVEQVYFVASHGPRPDIEDAMRTLGNQPRRLAAATYRPVGEPAVVPTRGMVKVSAPRQVSVKAGSSVDQVMAASFEAAEGRDLVVTRWFRHE